MVAVQCNIVTFGENCSIVQSLQIIQTIKHCIIPIKQWCSKTCWTWTWMQQYIALYALLFSEIPLVKIWISLSELRFSLATSFHLICTKSLVWQEVVQSCKCKCFFRSFVGQYHNISPFRTMGRSGNWFPSDLYLVFVVDIKFFNPANIGALWSAFSEISLVKI